MKFTIKSLLIIIITNSIITGCTSTQYIELITPITERANDFVPNKTSLSDVKAIFGEPNMYSETEYVTSASWNQWIGNCLHSVTLAFRPNTQIFYQISLKQRNCI